MSNNSYGYGKKRSKKEWKRAYEDVRNTIDALEADGLSASVYTQVSDIEEEVNGIMTYDRKISKLLNTERRNHGNKDI